MKLLQVISVITAVILQWSSSSQTSSTDLPCASRAVKNRSILCVCTADYCDTVRRVPPEYNKYVIYVSSEAGLRFEKSIAYFRDYEEEDDSYLTLEIDPTTKYQTINGFGGAVTDAAGINWKNLSNPQLMQHLIESYCGDSGIQYNMLRVPIGGTDFSTRAYAYNEMPEDDVTLSNFTLAYEDYEYKIPMIKACMKAASAPIHIVSATWSPPLWMKTKPTYKGGYLKKQYMQTYADYHYKFIQEYAEQGIQVWGLSTGNEPLDGTIDYVDVNKIGWKLYELGHWIEKHLGPTIRGSKFKDVKIMSGDDQRYTINLYWNTLLLMIPGTIKYLDGVAVHWYLNKYTPASILTQAMKGYPDKFVISSEASAGSNLTDSATVDLGSWSRAEQYIVDIIENLSNNVISWIDWNMCLNPDGGPNWTGSAVDSPIIVNAEAGEFYKQPMFYAMGHFSKFVPRGSQRIKVTVNNDTNIQNIGFLTPYKTVVVVLLNEDEKTKVKIRLGKREAVLHIEARSITTVEMSATGDTTTTTENISTHKFNYGY